MEEVADRHWFSAIQLRQRASGRIDRMIDKLNDRGTFPQKRSVGTVAGATTSDAILAAAAASTKAKHSTAKARSLPSFLRNAISVYQPLSSVVYLER